jgi:hypothetical protein
MADQNRIQAVSTKAGDGFRITLDALDCEKPYFLRDVKEAVRCYITKQSVATCLSIIEILQWTELGGGIRTVQRRYSASLSFDYGLRFLAFLRGSGEAHPPTYRGNRLDSFLSDPVKSEIVQKYERLFTKNQDAIAKGLVLKLTASDPVAEDLSSQFKAQLFLVRPPVPNDELREISKFTPDDIFGPIVTNQLIVTGGNETGEYGLSVAAAVKSSLEASISALVQSYLVTDEFRKKTEQASRDAVIRTIIVTIATTVSAALGIAITSSTLWWMILPAVASFASIAYGATTFPSDLGVKVSEAIGKQLNDSFREENTKTLTKIFRETVEENITKLAFDLAKDTSVIRSLREEARVRVQGGC